LSGLWLGMPACLEVFDGLVRRFFSSPLEDRTAILAEAELAKSELTDPLSLERAAVYVKTMQKVSIWQSVRYNLIDFFQLARAH